jgi:hypothetical protein
VVPDDIVGTAIGGVFAIEVKSRGEAGGESDGSAGAFGRMVIGDFTETFVVPWGSGRGRLPRQLAAGVRSAGG